MISLYVTNFSALKEARLDLSRITVLIGPQASGKSIICKLNYFFLEIFDDQRRYLSDGRSLDYFKDNIKEKFIEWFPVSAWGDKKFVIEFSAGDYKINMTRIGAKKNIRLSLSEQFASEYTSGLQKFQKNKPNDFTDYELERETQVRRWIDRSRLKLLKKDNIASQLFIPAGRSFFTNIGKAVAAFEQGRFLDPLTIKFGRIFTAYKSRRLPLYMREKNEPNEKLLEETSKILGGKYVQDGEKEYVVLTDGREIPLTALSSGQQELLPLLTVLPALLRAYPYKYNRLVYIEEPEAHLFPMAQSNLVDVLARAVRVSNNSLDMLITTHSPYVLSKLNNLIKAGQIARKSPEKKGKLSKIIPEDGWLPRGYVGAYSINNGVMERIIDSDGSISADYLDSVSVEILEEYESLLDLEFTK